MGAAPAIGAEGDLVSLSFDDVAASSSADPTAATLVQPVTSPLSLGTAAINTQVVTRDGGQALAFEGRSGSALRLPAYSGSVAEPRAVVRVTSASGTDSLSPATANFAFGATARLDAASQGTTVDNGNNLLQRGLNTDGAQYKLDLDNRYPGCTVKGTLGKVSVRDFLAVTPDDWYTLTCTRTASTLTLTVDQHHADGTTTRRVKSKTGQIGAVTMASPMIPMSIGGKLNAKGAIVASSTDQFNGVVDDVFLRMTDIPVPLS
jgi:hypothetical protein